MEYLNEKNLNKKINSSPLNKELSKTEKSAKASYSRGTSTSNPKSSMDNLSRSSASSLASSSSSLSSSSASSLGKNPKRTAAPVVVQAEDVDDVDTKGDYEDDEVDDDVAEDDEDDDEVGSDFDTLSSTRSFQDDASSDDGYSKYSRSSSTRGGRSSPTKDTSDTASVSTISSERILAILETLEHLQPIVEVFKIFGFVLDIFFPIFEVMVAEWTKLRARLHEYHLGALMQIAAGLVMVFFGSSYFLTITTIEILRITNWAELRRAFLVLYAEYQAIDDNENDDQVTDDDDDNERDTESIRSYMNNTSHKIKLVAKSISIDLVQEFITALIVSYCCAVAVVKVNGAKSILFSVVIGEMLSGFLQAVSFPVLDQLIPVDYERWIPFLSVSFFQTIAFLFSLLFSSYFSSFYTSLRGAFMFVNGTISFARSANLLKNYDGRPSLVLLVWALIFAFTGFAWQNQMTKLPIFIEFLCFPMGWSEYVLSSIYYRS